MVACYSMRAILPLAPSPVCSPTSRVILCQVCRSQARNDDVAYPDSVFVDIIADVYAVETVSRFVQDHTERWTNETRIVTLTMDPLLDTVTVVLDYFRPRGQEARQQLQYHRQPDGTTVTSIEESCTLGLREVQNHHIESCEGLVNKILNQSCRSPKTFPRACYPLETRQHKFLRGLVRLLFKLHNQLSPKVCTEGPFVPRRCRS